MARYVLRFGDFEGFDLRKQSLCLDGQRAANLIAF